MKSGQLKLAAFILVLIANLTNPTYAFADSITGETDGDSLIIRGSSLSDGQTATAPSAPSTTITNCVSIGNGQLRCYAVDTAGSLLDGIAAASVVPGAAAGPSAADIAAAVVTEFRRLPLVSGAIQVQPSRGWTLVNVETIVLTSPAQQTFATSVLGIPVTVRQRGYRIVNIDCVIVAQLPKIAPYRAAMKERIASILSIDPQAVGVKGKTTEGLGPEGSGEAVAAHAVVLLERT